MNEKKQDKLLQFGLISAIVSSLLFVILYLGGIDWFKNNVILLTFVIALISSIIACREQKIIDKFLPFKSALRLSFGVFVITLFVSSLLSYILFNWIDPAFAESLKQLNIEQTQKLMEKLNISPEKIDQGINLMIKENMYSFKNIIFNFMNGCIIAFLISLVIAAIMKKKQEVFPS